ncbi:MAG: hypothetical protein AAF664_00335, partial [Planctomycetota bacterium]
MSPLKLSRRGLRPTWFLMWIILLSLERGEVFAQVNEPTPTTQGSQPDAIPGTMPPTDFELNFDAFMFLDRSGNRAYVPGMTFEDYTRMREARSESSLTGSEEDYQFDRAIITTKITEQRAELDIRFSLRLTRLSGSPIRIPLGLNNFHLLESPIVEGVNFPNFVQVEDRDGYFWNAQPPTQDQSVEVTPSVPLTIRLKMAAKVDPLGPSLTFRLPNLPTTIEMEVDQEEALIQTSGDQIVNRITSLETNASRTGGGTGRPKNPSEKSAAVIESSGGQIVVSWKRQQQAETSRSLLEVDSRTTIRWQSPDESPLGEVVMTLRSVKNSISQFELELPKGMTLLDTPRLGTAGQLVDMISTDEGADRKWQISIPLEEQQQRLELRFDVQLSNLLNASVIPGLSKADIAASRSIELPRVTGAIRHQGRVGINVGSENRLLWQPSSWVRRESGGVTDENGERVYRFRFERQTAVLPVWISEEEQQSSMVCDVDLVLASGIAKLRQTFDLTTVPRSGRLELNEAGWDIRSIVVDDSVTGSSELKPETFLSNNVRVIELDSFLSRATLRVTIEATAPLQTDPKTIELTIPHVLPESGLITIRDATLKLTSDLPSDLIVDLSKSEGLVRGKDTLAGSTSASITKESLFDLVDLERTPVVAGSLIPRLETFDQSIEATSQLIDETIETRFKMRVEAVSSELSDRLVFRFLGEKEGISNREQSPRLPHQWIAQVDGSQAIFKPLDDDSWELISDQLVGRSASIELVHRLSSIDDSQPIELQFPRLIADEVRVIQPIQWSFLGNSSSELVPVIPVASETPMFSEAGDFIQATYSWPLARPPTVSVKPFALETPVARVDRILSRTMVGSSLWQEQMILIASGNGNLPIELQLGPFQDSLRDPKNPTTIASSAQKAWEDGEVRIEARLDGTLIPVTGTSSGFVVPLGDDLSSKSTSGPPTAHQVDLRIWARKQTNLSFAKIHPLMVAPSSTQPTYWQVITPDSIHALHANAGTSRAMSWYFDGLRLIRRPVRTNNQLLSVFGGSDLRFPSGNRYLYVGNNPAGFLVTVSSKTVMWSLAGALAIVLAFVFDRFSWFLHPSSLIVASVALVGLMLLAPDAAVLLGQAAILSLILIGVMVAVRTLGTPQTSRRVVVSTRSSTSPKATSQSSPTAGGSRSNQAAGSSLHTDDPPPSLSATRSIETHEPLATTPREGLGFADVEAAPASDSAASSQPSTHRGGLAKGLIFLAFVTQANTVGAQQEEAENVSEPAIGETVEPTSSDLIEGLPTTWDGQNSISLLGFYESQSIDALPKDYEPILLKDMSDAIARRQAGQQVSGNTTLDSAIYVGEIVGEQLRIVESRLSFTNGTPITRSPRSLGRSNLNNLAISIAEYPKQAPIASADRINLDFGFQDGEIFLWSTISSYEPALIDGLRITGWIPLQNPGLGRQFTMNCPKAATSSLYLRLRPDESIESSVGTINDNLRPPEFFETAETTGQEANVRWIRLDFGGKDSIVANINSGIIEKQDSSSDIAIKNRNKRLILHRQDIAYDIRSESVAWDQQMELTYFGGPFPDLILQDTAISDVSINNRSVNFEIIARNSDDDTPTNEIKVLRLEAAEQRLASEETITLKISGSYRWNGDPPLKRIYLPPSETITLSGDDSIVVRVSSNLNVVRWDLPSDWQATRDTRSLAFDGTRSSLGIDTENVDRNIASNDDPGTSSLWTLTGPSTVDVSQDALTPERPQWAKILVNRPTVDQPSQLWTALSIKGDILQNRTIAIYEADVNLPEWIRLRFNSAYEVDPPTIVNGSLTPQRFKNGRTGEWTLWPAIDDWASQTLESEESNPGPSVSRKQLFVELIGRTTFPAFGNRTFTVPQLIEGASAPTISVLKSETPIVIRGEEAFSAKPFTKASIDDLGKSELGKKAQTWLVQQLGSAAANGKSFVHQSSTPATLRVASLPIRSSRVDRLGFALHASREPDVIEERLLWWKPSDSLRRSGEVSIAWPERRSLGKSIAETRWYLCQNDTQAKTRIELGTHWLLNRNSSNLDGVSRILPELGIVIPEGERESTFKVRTTELPPGTMGLLGVRTWRSKNSLSDESLEIVLPSIIDSLQAIGDAWLVGPTLLPSSDPGVRKRPLDQNVLATDASHLEYDATSIHTVQLDRHPAQKIETNQFQDITISCLLDSNFNDQVQFTSRVTSSNNIKIRHDPTLKPLSIWVNGIEVEDESDRDDVIEISTSIAKWEGSRFGNSDISANLAISWYRSSFQSPWLLRWAPPSISPEGVVEAPIVRYAISPSIYPFLVSAPRETDTAEKIQSKNRLPNRLSANFPGPKNEDFLDQKWSFVDSGQSVWLIDVSCLLVLLMSLSMVLAAAGWFLVMAQSRIPVCVLAVFAVGCLILPSARAAIAGWCVLPLASGALLGFRHRKPKASPTKEPEQASTHSGSFSLAKGIIASSILILGHQCSFAQTGSGFTTNAPPAGELTPADFGPVMIPVKVDGNIASPYAYLNPNAKDWLFPLDNEFGEEVQPVIQQTDYRCEVSQDDLEKPSGSLRIEADWEIYVPPTKTEAPRSSEPAEKMIWVSLPLDRGSVERIETARDQNVVSVVQDDDGIKVRLNEGRSHRLRLSLLASISIQSRRTQIRMRVPQCLRSNVQVESSVDLDAVRLGGSEGTLLEKTDVRRWSQTTIIDDDELLIDFRHDTDTEQSQGSNALQRRYYLRASKVGISILGEFQFGVPAVKSETRSIVVRDSRPVTLLSTDWELVTQTLPSLNRRLITVKALESNPNPLFLLWQLPLFEDQPDTEAESQIRGIDISVPEVVAGSLGENAQALLALAGSTGVSWLSPSLEEAKPIAAEGFYAAWTGRRGAVDSAFVANDRIPTLTLQLDKQHEILVDQKQVLVAEPSRLIFESRIELVGAAGPGIPEPAGGWCLRIPRGFITTELTIDGTPVSGWIHDSNTSRSETYVPLGPFDISSSIIHWTGESSIRGSNVQPIPSVELVPINRNGAAVARIQSSRYEIFRRPNTMITFRGQDRSTQQPRSLWVDATDETRREWMVGSLIPVKVWSNFDREAQSDIALRVRRTGSPPKANLVTTIDYESSQWSLDCSVTSTSPPTFPWVDLEIPSDWNENLEVSEGISLVTPSFIVLEQGRDVTVFRISALSRNAVELNLRLLTTLKQSVESRWNVPIVRLPTHDVIRYEISLPTKVSGREMLYNRRGVAVAGIRGNDSTKNRRQFVVKRENWLIEAESRPPPTRSTSVLMEEHQFSIQSNSVVLCSTWDVAPDPRRTLAIEIPQPFQVQRLLCENKPAKILDQDLVESSLSESSRFNLILEYSDVPQTIKVVCSVKNPEAIRTLPSLVGQGSATQWISMLNQTP